MNAKQFENLLHELGAHSTADEQAPNSCSKSQTALRSRRISSFWLTCCVWLPGIAPVWSHGH